MPCPRSAQNGLRLLGWACLLLASLPYYSKTTRTAAGVEKTVIGVDLPGQGDKTPPINSTAYVVRIGLPCSPLFLYERSVTSAQVGTAHDGPAEANASISSEGFRMALRVVSWSMGLAVLAEVLFIAARRCRRKQQTAAKPATDASDQPLA